MSLQKNTLWNVLGNTVPFAVGLITIPYLVRQIGLEAFGVLSIVWMLVGYFSLFDFGLGRALTRQIASVRAGEQSHEIRSIVVHGLRFTAVTGLAGTLILALLASIAVHRWLNIRPGLQQEALWALILAACAIPLTTVTTGLRGILEAFESFKSINLMRILLGTINFALPAIVVSFGYQTLVWLVSTLVFGRFFIFWLHAVIVARKLKEIPSKVVISKSTKRELIAYGAWMTVSNVIGPLIVYSDRFFIAGALGATSVAFYSVPADALSKVLLLPSALTNALFPRLANLRSSNKTKEVTLYVKSVVFVLVVLITICVPISLGAHSLLKLWLTEDFARHSAAITSILAIGIIFNGLAQVPLARLQALGMPKITAILHAFEFCIYIPVLIFFLKIGGIEGVAYAWTARVMFDCIALLFLASHFNK